MKYDVIWFDLVNYLVNYIAYEHRFFLLFSLASQIVLSFRRMKMQIEVDKRKSWINFPIVDVHVQV